jgi:hypothetical protein
MADLASAVDSGIPVEQYLACLDAGATHAEITDANDLVDLTLYARYRHDLTHPQALHFISGDFYFDGYRAACAAGATQDELDQAYRYLRDGLRLYARARAAGATHNETIMAYRANVTPDDYALIRETGASHYQVMLAQTLHIRPTIYVLNHRMGYSHQEILSAAETGRHTTTP